jgi:hypothetical protein
MIAVRLEGRTGNQLFQYAFIYSVSKKLKTSFYIDKSAIGFLLPKYFEIKPNHLSFADNYIFSVSGYKNIFNHHLKVAFYNLVKKIYGLTQVEFGNDLHPADQLKNIRDKTLYTGFFQSEDYFIDQRDDLIKLFSVKNIHKEQFKNIIKSLTGAIKIVTVHVRRGDYTGLNFALSPGYYKRAI